MGCGRVGATLARGLEAQGHSVSVIDINAEAFRRLGPNFNGRIIKGVGFDRDVLIKAGIRTADGFAAVSSGDNSNVIAARIVREMFGVTNVIARIYDQNRAEVYEKLGIPTVATVRWAAGQVMSRLIKGAPEPVWYEPTGHAGLVQLSYDPAWIGRTIFSIEHDLQSRVAIFIRAGVGAVPDQTTVLQEDDILYWAVSVTEIAQISAQLSQPPYLENQN